MKASEIVETQLIKKMKGTAEHPFDVMTYEQIEALHKCFRTVEVFLAHTITIPVHKAPEWLKLIQRGEKINAIKAVRARMETHEGKSPSLLNSKNFIEEMQRAIQDAT
ncbi:hypothetical protein [Rhizobium phage RHph_X2_28B]|uniref:hypothetical protein n=1 Tax=Rhizobium phage RHph_X2_28B TaxID=2836086 RepID=UPI00232957E5|nr:hypothetical protein PP751_gp009 [Rhizobium phage RHph_X2_28B]QWY83461.1 hypothetical protein [Rhizobium phage RHph_X2_28B]QWY83697.1 hypothetical protein [Rhizobium phage RHph_X3_15]